MCSNELIKSDTNVRELWQSRHGLKANILARNVTEIILNAITNTKVEI